MEKFIIHTQNYSVIPAWLRIYIYIYIYILKKKIWIVKISIQNYSRIMITLPTSPLLQAYLRAHCPDFTAPLPGIRTRRRSGFDSISDETKITALS
jgi:hypothetical protein